MTATATATVVDRTQRARAARGDRFVVAEDVVDLVAAGAPRGRQTANRAAGFAVPITVTSRDLVGFLGPGFRFEVVFVFRTVVVFLGKTEVDKCFVPSYPSRAMTFPVFRPR